MNIYIYGSYVRILCDCGEFALDDDASECLEMYIERESGVRVFRVHTRNP